MTEGYEIQCKNLAVSYLIISMVIKLDLNWAIKRPIIKKIVYWIVLSGKLFFESDVNYYPQFKNK